MREPVIGIDLGTSTSAVATVEGGRPRIIPNRNGAPLTPSLVGFSPKGERVVGDAAARLEDELPENVAAATKRFIGRRWSAELAEDAASIVAYPLIEGPNGEIRVEIAGRVLPITQVSAMILGELKLDAQAYFGRPVTQCVITVPANFDDPQRQATKEAAQIAGLEVMRIVNEPTAAAVAYGLTQKFEGRALVFDLGGGTFDVSILEVERGVFQVKATGGDPLLGGEDFDARIVQWLLAQLPEPFRAAARNDKLSLRRLHVAAETAKRELSVAEEAFLSVRGLGNHAAGTDASLTDLDTALTRPFFETLSEPLTRRCMAVCQKLMTEARLEPQSVDVILLVGGMTRVPLIRRLVADFFGKEPVTGVNPDEVVALGAAVHASELAAQADSQALLIDVASHSLSVGTLGGGVRKLVAKNTPIPTVAKEMFLPGRAGQNEARIEIFQGEHDFSDENVKLGEVVLKRLQVVERAGNPLEVTFQLSSEGTLSVKAVDTISGQAETLQLEARAELPRAELEKLEKEQRAYAKDREKKDAVISSNSFKRLLDKGEKLAALLQKSAEENPSLEAEALVGSVKSLLDQGRAAFKMQNAAQMVELGGRLHQLVSPR